MTMTSLRPGFRALVIGASGAIGGALVQRLGADPGCAGVVGLHRRSSPPLDLAREETIATAAAALAELAPFDLLVNAAGILHTPDYMPEKRLSDLNAVQLLETFRVNACGPALVIRHFRALLGSERAVMALLSAKVGSIEDNRLGGWYSYRASKAALNMLVKTAAIELRRTNPAAVVVALHPGTVTSALSQPFRGAESGRPAAAAAADLLAVIDELQPADSGQFRSYSGERLPW
jgi:NAD(P)-dependent dehydrogenase (short-subunit alcohol dehydrogenase family)